MAVNKFNLAVDERAARKLLITVAEWRNDTDPSQYVATEFKPLDWDTKYTSYYTRSGTASSYTYSHVTGETAPTWSSGTYFMGVDRTILGKRTPDSSIEYNVDSETSTDILGFNYTDVNKTQPQQSFDPHLILGGDKFSEKMNDIRKRNALTELQQFTLYVITAFVTVDTNKYEAERHTGCTILYESIGGEDNVNFPLTAYFSNNITNGKVDKLSDDFTFEAVTPVSL